VHAIAAKHGLHPTQVSQWKREVAGRLPEVFARTPGALAEEAQARGKELYEEIGWLKMQLEWLKKKLARLGTEERRRMIEPEHPKLPVTEQCALIGLPRSSYYHQPLPESGTNRQLMRVIDETYLACPFFGSRQMTLWLRAQGHRVNRKRMRRLMRLMGLESLSPQPKLSAPNRAHPVYPYLLRNLEVTRPNQVWATDITYLPLPGGHVYLCAVIDWHSRFVLSWELSNTLDASFCTRAVQRAIAQYGAPEIFNTDQGCQFTSAEFTQPLLDAGIKLSMDGKGRCLDNVFVERLWRTVKFEEVYLKSYRSLVDAHEHLETYFRFYNEGRPHTAHAGGTPGAAYRGQPMITSADRALPAASLGTPVLGSAQSACPASLPSILFSRSSCPMDGVHLTSASPRETMIGLSRRNRSGGSVIRQTA
jgi:putative transposase